MDSQDRAAASDHAVSVVRDAEHQVDRAAWDVHCCIVAAERCEAEGRKQRADEAKAREGLVVKQRALDAIRSQFPEVEPQEVDLYGVA